MTSRLRLAWFVDYVGANWGPGDVLITRERHRLALRQTGDALSRALEVEPTRLVRDFLRGLDPGHQPG